MKNTSKANLFFAILTGLLFLSGCAAVRLEYSPVTQTKYPAKPATRTMLVLNNDITEKYQALGVVNAGGNGYAKQIDLMRKMADKARQLGGDAVIKVEYASETTDHGTGDIPVRIKRLHASGVVIVLLDEDVIRRYFEAIDRGEIEEAYRAIGAPTLSNP